MKSKISCYRPTSSNPYTPVSTPFLVLDESKLFQNVTYTQCVNADIDLQFGQVVSAQITFSTKEVTNGTYSIDKNTIIKYESIQENYGDTWRTKGWFYVADVRKNETTYTVTAYDAVSKLDVDITSWLANQRNSVTLWQLYSNIITKCQLTNGNSSSFIVNGSYSVVPATLATASVTARTIMHYIAEAVGGFITAKDRSIYLDIFGVPSASGGDTGAIASVTSKDYSRLTLADKPAPIVSAINVQLSSGNCRKGNSNSTADMVYLFNPIFYNTPANNTALGNAIQLIYNKRIVEQLGPHNQDGGMYYSASFHLFSDRIKFTYNGQTVYKTINAGDVIKVNGKTVYVFSKTINETGCDISSTGDPQRVPVVTENTDRISNLEADAFGRVYIGNITADDLILPSGLGYPDNPSNTSLIEVIRYLLRPSEPSAITRRLGIGDSYNTSYSTGSYTASGGNSTLTVSNVGGVWVINNTGTSDGTITIKQGTTPVKTYTCYCYNLVSTVNSQVDLYFDDISTAQHPVDEQSYYYRIYKNGTHVKSGTGPITTQSDITTYGLSLETDEPDNKMYFHFMSTGNWRVEIANRSSPSEDIATLYYYIQ